MSWHLIIRSNDVDKEIICSQLWDSQTTGILIDEDNKITAGFESKELAEAAQNILEGDSKVVPDNSDWSQPNINHLNIQTEKELIKLKIESSRVFGHGKHPTTSLAIDYIIEVMTQNIKPDAAAPNFLDVGTGSGVLAILASKLGATSFGIDNNPDAIKAANINASVNNVKNINFSLDDLESFDIKFDLIVANLLLPIQKELANKITDLLKPNANLIVSGILQTQSKELLSYYKTLKVVNFKDLDSWVTYKFTNK